MRVRWSETALAEVEAIFSFIYERNHSAATSVVQRVEELTALLGEFPLAGHLTDETAVRMISVVRYPFLIFYTIDDGAAEVVILHVRHTAQAP
jgi:plasmid stabilization system protein ParE